MPFNELHQKFGPHIRQLFENNNESAIRQLLHQLTLPLLDEYERYLPENLATAFKTKRWEGLSIACAEARDNLDDRAANAEGNAATREQLDAYSRAGVVLEMMGYLDEAPLTPNTVFNFLYYLGVFQSDESITNKLTAHNY